MEEKKLLRFLTELKSKTYICITLELILFLLLLSNNIYADINAAVGIGTQIIDDKGILGITTANETNNNPKPNSIDVLARLIHSKEEYHASENHDSENHPSDNNWLYDLKTKAIDITLENILEKAKELPTAHLPKIEKFNLSQVQNSKAILRIFVSSSMPLSLLKTYKAQAENYGAILVFRGLPKGSFKELIKLVMDINGLGNSEASSMQIDDEAFGKFNVRTVPTIVLSKEDNCWLDPDKCQLSFDKITGGVSLKYALEQFAKKGEMNVQARELLE